MAARPWEHAERAKAALRAIMDDPDLGVAVLSSGRLAANVLEDLLPEAPRERAILVLAAQAGIAQALRDHVAHGLDDATAISLAVVSLEDNSPLDHDSCEWVVSQIAAAVGLVPAQPRTAQPLAAEPVTRLALPEELQAAPTVTAQAPPPTPPPLRPKRKKRRRVAVICAAFSRDGQLLATGADDGSASVWDVGSGALLHRLTGHHGQVLAAAFSSAGTFVATAAAGDVARLWNVSSGTLERDITPGPAWHVAFSPDGKLVATAGGSASQPAGVAAPAATEIAARFWSTATGALVRSTAGSFLGHADAVAFSADGELLATAGGGRAPATGVAAAGLIDNSAWLWQVTTGALVRELAGHVGQVQTVAFSPDGSLLTSTARDRTARVWNLRSADLASRVLDG